MIGLFIFSFSYLFSLGRLYLSENLSISSRFPFFGIELLVVVSFDPLCFCDVGCNCSSFISDFIYLGSLSVFFDESG